MCDVSVSPCECMAELIGIVRVRLHQLPSLFRLPSSPDPDSGLESVLCPRVREECTRIGTLEPTGDDGCGLSRRRRRPSPV